MTVDIERLYWLTGLLYDLGAQKLAEQVGLSITEIETSRSGLARANVVAKKVNDRFCSTARAMVGPDYALGFNEACEKIIEAAAEVKGETDLVAENQRLRAALQVIADLPTPREILRDGLSVDKAVISYNRIIDDARDTLARKVGT